ncbi:MAG: metal ABC transporter permease [Nitrososphaeria archaeon]|nr:metal ABC transporter permease [Nitrososphaeria archaeon]
MLDPFSPFLVRAYFAILLTGFISLSSGFALLRGVAYLPAEASHSALGGAAIGVFIGYIFRTEVEPFYFAILFSSFTAMLVSYAGKHGGAEVLNAALGGMLAISVSFYALLRALVPAELKVVVDGYLVGDILLLTLDDLIRLATVIFFGTLIVYLFKSEILYVCFDPEGAEALGLNVSFYDYILFFFMGLAGGLAAKTIGSLMVFALIMLPAVIAKGYSRNIRKYFLITILLTLFFGYSGIIVSIISGLPSSGSIAAISSFSYIISIILNKRRK